MDLLMDAQQLNGDYPSDWDFHLSKGLSTPLHGAQELRQKAAISAFLQRATIEGLPLLGVHWTEFLTGSVSPRELDAELRENMHDFTNSTTFVPYYFSKNQRLQLSIQEAENVRSV